MKERPIIFQGWSVQAIMRGNKGETRRIPKDQPQTQLLNNQEMIVMPNGNLCAPKIYHWLVECPFGVIGDRFWVRETWGERRADGQIVYRADDRHQLGSSNPWRSSRFMPRVASRILLEITFVRFERLHTIDSANAIPEGIIGLSKDDGRTWKYGIPDRDGLPGTDDEGWAWEDWMDTPRGAFARAWEKINGKRGHGWETNPFVWVLTFKRVNP